jgi:hypothetical protein
MATQFTVVTYLVPNSQTYCAPADYICCSSYAMVNNNCVRQYNVSLRDNIIKERIPFLDESTVASLEYLIQLGLIGDIGKK